METLFPPTRGRGRGGLAGDLGRGRPHSRNKHWTPGDNARSNTPVHSDGERWERGGHRGGGRGSRGGRGVPRQFPNVSLRVNQGSAKGKERATDNFSAEVHDGEAEHHLEDALHEIDEPELETQEERERFYQELVKAREVERKKAIAEGKMDDPLVPKRLEDAISIVGTCHDMCPRFERYRRERENNLFEWETIPGTKRVDHKRAVKMYERAAGDKILPSDLRPPSVLKRTLDYLFHDLLPRGGLSKTATFIRDRSRAVRNDFTLQHITNSVAIECHDRCARFHILSLHFEGDKPGFSVPLEDQQLMNTLQSLKEFYDTERGRYEAPTEMEMRVYHRLIHIRDQRERYENIPDHITSHPVFKLTTDFRLHVQKRSAPITKTSPLVVDAEAMEIFSQLANVLRDQGSVVMIYLVACILERLFGRETIDDIEAIRGDLTIPDLIDGNSTGSGFPNGIHEDIVDEEMDDSEFLDEDHEQYDRLAEGPVSAPTPVKPNAAEWSASMFGSQPSNSTASAFSVPTPSAVPSPFGAPATAGSAFASITTTPNVFGTPSIFGNSAFQPSAVSANPPKSVFGQAPPSTSELPSSSSPLSQSDHSTVNQSNPPPGNIFDGTTLLFPPSASNPLPSSQPFNARASLSERAKAVFGGPPATNTSPSTTVNKNENILSLNTTPSFFPLNANAAPYTPPSANQPPPHPSVPNESTPAARDSPSNNIPPIPPVPLALTRSHSSSTDTSHGSTPSLKIDTGAPASPSDYFAPSPKVPPLLSRKAPISLPSTPSMNSFPPNALLGHLRNNLAFPTGPLSPLTLQTPIPSPSRIHNFSPAPRTTKGLGLQPTLSAISLDGENKRPEVVADPSEESRTILKKKAHDFSQGSLFKRYYGQWKRKFGVKATWIEAYQRSDAYRQKIQKTRQTHNASPDRKRTISTSITASSESPHKKRAKRRISSDYQPPRDDEELAKRFKENQEEHERRWAQGSFLQVIRNHVKGRPNHHSSAHTVPWQIWLSMNPESDATAIWLERKFNVPDSGEWVSEAIFSILLSPSKVSKGPGYPGILIFECTPIEGVSDEIERKYRVLDDCSRLRDIVKALPPKRHFIPSLLIFCWTEGKESYPAADFFDMVKKFVAEGILESYHVFAMTSTTKDLDRKLDDAMKSLSLDTEGKLVQALTVRGIYKLFESTFNSFLTEWIENCSANDFFDWYIYGQLAQAAIELLNTIGQSVHFLTNTGGESKLLPFNSDSVEDSDSTYEAAKQWLSIINQRGDASKVIMDLQSHRNIGQDFPVRAFVEHVAELLQTRWENLLGAKKLHYVAVTAVKTALQSFQSAIQHHQMKLGQVLISSIRRSPKRRSSSVDTTQTSPQAKRIRLSTSADASVYGVDDEPSPFSSPLLNGRNTPSPSASVVSLSTNATEAPAVTVAMLRALTRDMKRKYASAS